MRSGILRDGDPADWITTQEAFPMPNEGAALAPERAKSEPSINRLRAPYETIHRLCCAEPIPAEVFPARVPRGPAH